MPRLVIPLAKPRLTAGFGTLPFMLMAEIKDIAEFPISPVWAAPGGMTEAGYAYDHEAEAPIAALRWAKTTNAILIVQGRKYHVIDIQENMFVPHLVLRLRRMEHTI